MNHAHDAQKKVEVLHVGKYFPPDPGGMETYLRDLMVCSLNRGMRSAALVHSARPAFRSSEENFAAGHSTLAVTRAAAWFTVLFTPISPSFPWILRGLIRRWQPKALHLHLPNPSCFWALLLPSARRLPWIVHWQSDVLTPHSGRLIHWLYRLYSPIELKLLRQAANVVVTSEQYLATSVTLAPFKDKCVVIPLGIKDRFYELNHTAEITLNTRSPLRVIAVGRLAHYKGLDTLLHAISQTQHTELDLIGNGRQLKRLKAMCHQLAIADRVRFHGSVNDQERDQLLRRSDCLCLASTDRTESFGIVLLEAMSARKACVVTDVPGSGMTSVVQEGQTGLVVSRGDSGALAAALEELARDRDQLIKLGNQGRERFVQAFTIERSTQAILDLYARI